MDKREHSGWVAYNNDGVYSLMRIDNSDGEREEIFEGNWLEFDSEEEWRQAWREKKAAPGHNAIRKLEGITGYKNNSQYVIGNYDDGFFILDMANDAVEVWEDKSVWTTEVKSRTTMNTENLTDPKAWSVQHRDLYVTLLIAAAIMLPWAFAPLWRKS